MKFIIVSFFISLSSFSYTLIGKSHSNSRCEVKFFKEGERKPFSKFSFNYEEDKTVFSEEYFFAKNFYGADIDGNDDFYCDYRKYSLPGETIFRFFSKESSVFYEYVISYEGYDLDLSKIETVEVRLVKLKKRIPRYLNRACSKIKNKKFDKVISCSK